MLKKFAFAIAAGLLCTTTAIAQTGQNKKFSHQVGVQMNELIRQVFNFNSSTGTVTQNPYLLTYSINSVRRGWGLRLGVGYEYHSFNDGDEVNQRETRIDNLNARFGIEKAFRLSNKWTAGTGLDAVYRIDKDLTNTEFQSSFDTVTTITDSRVEGIGGGAMAWLRYQIAPNVLIGTETSYYYTSGSQSQDISITRRDFNIPGRPYQTKVTKIDGDEKQGSFRVPMVFYLIVRF